MFKYHWREFILIDASTNEKVRTIKVKQYKWMTFDDLCDAAEYECRCWIAQQETATSRLHVGGGWYCELADVYGG